MLTPHDIIAGFLAGMIARVASLKRNERPSPQLPDNDARRLLACLHRGGYVNVPRQPTEKMLARGGDAEVWRRMIETFEDEARKVGRRAKLLDFIALTNEGAENG